MAVVTEWTLVATLLGGGIHSRSVHSRSIGDYKEFAGCSTDAHAIAEHIRINHRLHIEWMPEQPYLLATADFKTVGNFTVNQKIFSDTQYCASWTILDSTNIDIPPP